jgi:hypothetical protein
LMQHGHARIDLLLCSAASILARLQPVRHHPEEPNVG